jgi:arginyl-tRNA synthetase
VKNLISENPLADFRAECQKILEVATKQKFPEFKIVDLAFEKPPKMTFGQLASPLCFDIAKKTGDDPRTLAAGLAEAIDDTMFNLVDHVVAAGRGYINFHVDFEKFSTLTIASIRKLDESFGLVKTDNPTTFIVEHTSANPLHPMHIGQARNPMLGDAIARLLQSRGYKVYRHFYVDDVGRQSAVLAFGYENLGRPQPEGKPDHFLGKVYTITNCIVEINRLKKALEPLKTLETDDYSKLNKDLDSWMSIAAELEERYPSLFNSLLQKISQEPSPEKTINELNLAYEKGADHAKDLIRKVSEICLQGITQTMNRAEVFYDSWDWESDLAWSGKVQHVLEELKKTPYVSSVGGVLEFDAERVAQDLNLKHRLDLKETYEIPLLTLVRSDGSTLYPTRDIAYTLWKFKKAERVINVVGIDQKLPQLQLKIALYALGYSSYADKLTHFAYNLVSLPGYKMSSRRGRYITLDEALNEAVERAYEEVSKRSPQLPEDDKRRIADFVGLGAVRYALVEVDPAKPVLFTWDRVLNFETNSAPYIQYSHARACSILRKAERTPEKPSYELLTEELEQEIIMILSSFPDNFIEAAELMKPNLIADFANALADKFNTFYNALPVIKAGSQGLSDARLTLVEAVKITLRNALELIGILAPERM